MKYLLLVLVLVTAVSTTAEGQNCRADLDDNRVVNFGDFLLFVDQFNLTPSTGCTPMPFDCQYAVQVAVANQRQESKKVLQEAIDRHNRCGHDLQRCNEESSRVIARKDTVIARMERAVKDSFYAPGTFFGNLRYDLSKLISSHKDVEQKLEEAWKLLRYSLADRYVATRQLDKAKACAVVNNGVRVIDFNGSFDRTVRLTGAMVSAFASQGVLSDDQYRDFRDDGNNFVGRHPWIENGGHIPLGEAGGHLGARRSHLLRRDNSWGKYFLTATGRARVKSMLGCE